MQEIDAILQQYTAKGKLPCAFGAAVTRENGLVYVGSAGLKDIENPESKVHNDSVLAFYSCTKAITATALLILLEDGLVSSIDDPVELYVPDIKEIKVLEKFDENNKPILVEAKTKATIRHLLTNTAGFSYTLFSSKYKTLQETTGAGNVLNSTWEDFKTPFIFEPGTKWHYGVGIDWVGKIVYEVSGMSLGDFCKKRIFEPLGAKSLTFARDAKQIQESVEIHQRDLIDSSKLTPLRNIPKTEPEFHAGGQGCYGTISDYMKFLEIFLHDGKSPQTGAQILRPETVHKYSFTNLLPEGVKITNTLEHSDPLLSNVVTFLDDVPADEKGWTANFYKIYRELPTGRGKNNLSWAGLSNLYYWIDIERGVAGIFATQLFPFADPVALAASNDFETAVYQHLLPVEDA